MTSESTYSQLETSSSPMQSPDPATLASLPQTISPDSASKPARNSVAFSTYVGPPLGGPFTIYICNICNLSGLGSTEARPIQVFPTDTVSDVRRTIRGIYGKGSVPRGTSFVKECKVEKKEPESAQVTGGKGGSVETTSGYSFVTLEEGKILKEYGISDGEAIFANQDPNELPAGEEEGEEEEIEEWTAEESDGIPGEPEVQVEPDLTDTRSLSPVASKGFELGPPQTIEVTPKITEVAVCNWPASSNRQSNRKDLFYKGNRLRMSFFLEEQNHDVKLNDVDSNIPKASSNVDSVGGRGKSHKIHISLSLISAPETRVSDATVKIVFASNVIITQIEPGKSITNGMESEFHVAREKKHELQGSIFSSSLIPVEASTGLTSSNSTQYEYTRRTQGTITGDGVGSQYAYWVMKEDRGEAGRNGLDSHIEMSAMAKVDGHEDDKPVIVEREVKATFVKGPVGAKKGFWNSKTVTLLAKCETGVIAF